MVQRRAVRWINNDYTRGENSITAQRKQLKWPTLEHRRLESRMVIFYKIIHNQIAIPIPSYLVKATRVTRQGTLYIRPRTSSTSYMESFFPRTVADWNYLPSVVRDAPSLESFKTGLSNLYTY